MEPDSARKKKGLACPRCGNRLRLRADQMGSQIMCPKCSATLTVARPASQASSSLSGSDDAAYEPETPLTRSSVVPEEQLVDLSPSANRQSGYDVDWSTSDAVEVEAPHERPSGAEPDHLALAQARGLVRNEYVPDPPRWAFFSGVCTFPWQGANLTRWVAIAFGLSVTGELLVATVENMRGGMRLGALLLPILSMFSAVMALLTFSFVAPCFLAAVQDTADGFDEVQESSLPEWDQWFFSFFSMLNVWMLAGAIGFPLTLFEPIGPAAIPVCTMLLFPVLLLSAMECESFLVPFSPPILASLMRAWWAWLIFYLLTTVLVVGWFAVASWAIAFAPYLLVLVLAPALAAVMLIYARLLGRLGWCITGSPAAPQEARSAASPAIAKPAKRKRRRIVVPEDLDAAAQMVAERRPASAPPINVDRPR
jgi:DNA-directed RNA polymerase subunit RPC12/RpoP